MRAPTRHAATLICALVGLQQPLAAPALRAAEPYPAVAEVARVLGDATIVRNGFPQAAGPKTPVERWDRIRTGPLSRAMIRFPDGSRLTLGAEAEAIVEDFLLPDGRRRGALLFAVPKGAFRLVIEKAGRTLEPRVLIETAGTTLSVHAPDVWAGPVDGGHGVVAFDGKVFVRTPAGSTVLARRRQGTLVRGTDRPPDDPAVWNRSQIEAALATVAID